MLEDFFTRTTIGQTAVIAGLLMCAGLQMRDLGNGARAGWLVALLIYAAYALRVTSVGPDE